MGCGKNQVAVKVVFSRQNAQILVADDAKAHGGECALTQLGMMHDQIKSHSHLHVSIPAGNKQKRVIVKIMRKLNLEKIDINNT